MKNVTENTRLCVTVICEVLLLLCVRVTILQLLWLVIELAGTFLEMGCCHFMGCWCAPLLPIIDVTLDLMSSSSGGRCTRLLRFIVLVYFSKTLFQLV